MLCMLVEYCQHFKRTYCLDHLSVLKKDSVLPTVYYPSNKLHGFVSQSNMVWYGMVWCGVVWCGVVWCVVWYGVVWYGMVWHNLDTL